MPQSVAKGSLVSLQGIRVIDILTRQPIAGARVFVEGIERLGISNTTGHYSFLPPQKSAYRIRVEAAGYMTTSEAHLSPRFTKAIEIAMPPLGQLEAADRLIRDAATFQAHRHQSYVEPLEAPTGIYPFSPTYPVPANIQMTNNTTNTYQVNGQSFPPGGTVTLPLEEYLKGVLPREIGTSFPLEAQKAQAVAARSYTVNYTRGGTRAICITTQCQVWGTTRYASTDQAVDETRSQVAVHGTTLVGGYFAASCGGRTRSNKDAGWSSTALPYLQPVDCIENKTGACSVICQGQPNNSTCWGVYGHRVGLCQRGAQAMGRCGRTYIQIIRHYYTGSDVANIAAAPVDDARLVSQAPAIGAKVEAGKAFTVRWTLENTGTTTWTRADGYALVRTGGTDLGVSRIDLASADQIRATQNKAFSVSMNAPAQAGTVKSTWQIEKQGRRFGPVLHLDVIVDIPIPECVDKDGDGYGVGPGCPEPKDCDDDNPNIYPGAREICGNGIDESCSGQDLPCPPDCVDNDKDGYFAKKDTCPEPHDCDDNNPNIYPGAPEICGNGIDESCAGQDLPCNPQKKPLGEPCQRHSDCQSDLCAEVSNAALCSQPCNATQKCPDGFSCLQDRACWPSTPTLRNCQDRCEDPDCKDATVCKTSPSLPTPGGSGCSCSTSSPLSPHLLLLLFLLPFLRRRRNA